MGAVGWACGMHASCHACRPRDYLLCLPLLPGQAGGAGAARLPGGAAPGAPPLGCIAMRVMARWQRAVCSCRARQQQQAPCVHSSPRHPLRRAQTLLRTLPAVLRCAGHGVRGVQPLPAAHAPGADNLLVRPRLGTARQDAARLGAAQPSVCGVVCPTCTVWPGARVHWCSKDLKP